MANIKGKQITESLLVTNVTGSNVSASASGSFLNVNVTDNIAASNITIASSGSFGTNLGVGTTTPAESLEVIGSISGSQSGSFLNVNVTDNLHVSNDIKLIDDGQVLFGAGNDMSIAHDGTDSSITNSTGDLTISSNTTNKDIILASGSTAFVTIDGSATLTQFNKSTRHLDSVISYFGTGLDGRIYHDGSNFYIAQVTTGDLYIQNELNDRDVILRSDDGSGGVTPYITLDGSATQTLLHQDTALTATKKLYFDGSGHTYISEVSDDLLEIHVGATRMLKFEEGSDDYVHTPDNVYLAVGNVKDFKIVHDGTDSYMVNSTGALNVSQSVSNADIKIGVNDGGTKINAIQIDASEIGRILLPNDNQLLSIGAGQDLYMFHDGTDSHIRTQTGDLYLTNVTSDEDIILRINDGGSADINALFIDASDAGTAIFNHDIKLPDGGKAIFGASSDVQIYHNGGGNSNIDNLTGDLYISQGTNDGDIFLRSDDGSGGVTPYLQLDGSAKYVRIPDDGIRLTLGADNDLAIFHNGTSGIIGCDTGDLIIQATTADKDVILKSDDASGGETAYITLDGSLGHSVINKNMRAVDSVKFTLGAADDAALYHDGTDTFFENATGNFYIRTTLDDGDIIFQSDDGSGGNATYLDLDGGNQLINFSKATRHLDSVIAYFGSGLDMKILHDGSNGYVTNVNTGDLYIQNELNDKDVILRSDDGSGGVTAYLTLDGSVGYTQAAKNIRFADNAKLQIGAGADLDFNHDGTDSTITNQTGDLTIQANTADADIIFSNDNGSGGNTNYLVLDGGAVTVDVKQDLRLTATKKILLDGGGNTHIVESAADIMDFVVGGDLMLRLDETNNIVSIPQDAATATFKMGLSGDYEQYVDGIDVIVRNKTTDGVYKVLTDNSVENMRFINTEVTFNEGSADMDFRIESNGEANMFFVNGGDNTVLIGSATSVANTAGTGALQVLGTGGGDTTLTIGRFSANASPPTLAFTKSRNGTIGSSTIVQDGDNLGQIIFSADDGTNHLSNSAKIEVEVDGTPGENDTPGRMVFFTTADGAQGAVERLRIDNAGDMQYTGDFSGSAATSASMGQLNLHAGGKIGIGTASPAQSIDIPAGRVIVGNNYGYVQRDAAGNSATVINQNGSDILLVGDTNHSDEVHIKSANSRAYITGNSDTPEFGLKESNGTLRFFMKYDSGLIMDSDSTFSIRANNTAGAKLELTNANGIMKLYTGTTAYGQFDGTGTDFEIKSMVNNADMFFRGIDGGAEITAMDIDMSDGGNVYLRADSRKLLLGAGGDLSLYHDGSNSSVQNGTGILYINNVANAALQLSTNNSARLTISADGATTQICQAAAQVSALHLHPRTGDNRKSMKITGEPYDESREDVIIIGLDAQSGVNELHIGSNTSANESPNTITMYTASGPTSATNVAHFKIDTDGTLTATDTSIGAISDRRVKKDIKNFTGGLDLISKLKPRTFKWREPEIHFDGVRRGFIAQEVQEVDEYWIKETEVKSDTADYKHVADTDGKSLVSKLSDKDAMYVSAIQELKQEIEELKRKIGENDGN